MKKNGYNIFGVINNGSKIENENLYNPIYEIPQKIISENTTITLNEIEKIVMESGSPD